MKTQTKILTFSYAEICQHGYSNADFAYTVNVLKFRTQVPAKKA